MFGFNTLKKVNKELTTKLSLKGNELEYTKIQLITHKDRIFFLQQTIEDKEKYIKILEEEIKMRKAQDSASKLYNDNSKNY